MAAPPISERHLAHFHRRQPIKEAVRVAATANVNTATGLNVGDVVDGVTLADGDRVLLPVQSTGSQNGLWIAGATPARAYDQSTDDPAFGFIVFVREGTANAQTLWRNTNTSAPTIDTTALTFAAITTASLAASSVTVADAGGFWTGVNVESVLQEIGALLDGVTVHGNTGATEAFAATTGVHTATLDANSTFTFTALASGLASAMVLILTQDGTGSRLATWPGSVVWPGGIVPVLSTAAGAVDALTFLSTDGGTTWFGFPTGGGGSSSLTIKDEGSSLATAATSIDFTGSGVTASGATAAKTVSVPVYEPLTSGAVAAPELVFDADGRCVMVAT